MEQGRLGCILFFFFLFVLLFNSQGGEAYKNYTVGDSLGWFDNLKVPKVNYQKWAAGKSFTLGDFLIFNTDMNHSVIQTYNETTYKHCDFNNADDHDTIEWSNQPSFDSTPMTVSVPLLKEGPTYFFSDNYDGEQCQHGQHFKINVMHGQGLPPSLLPPDSSAPAPNAADFVDAVPDTVVPSNFNNPKEVDDDHVKATSQAESRMIGLGLVITLLLLLVVFGL